MKRKTAKIRIRKRPDVMIWFGGLMLGCPTKTQCEVASILSLFPHKSPTKHPNDDVISLITDLMLHGY